MGIASYVDKDSVCNIQDAVRARAGFVISTRCGVIESLAYISAF